MPSSCSLQLEPWSHFVGAWKQLRQQLGIPGLQLQACVPELQTCSGRLQGSGPTCGSFLQCFRPRLEPAPPPTPQHFKSTYFPVLNAFCLKALNPDT